MGFAQLRPSNTAKEARQFLAALHKASPCHIRTLLTNNGSEYTGRLLNKQKQVSGHHEFDQLCVALATENRLTKPRHPQTNSMVERFNGRISEVLATHRFESGQDLEATLPRYVLQYNQHLPQRMLAYQTPLQTMKQ